MKPKKSIKELSIAVGRSPSAIYRWLRGDRNIGLEDAVVLSKLTGVRLELWLPGKISQNPYCTGIRAYNKKLLQLGNLEKNMTGTFDRELSLKIDKIKAQME
jgi:transcriptional regulator with XRE-family HTH domain